VSLSNPWHVSVIADYLTTTYVKNAGLNFDTSAVFAQTNLIIRNSNTGYTHYLLAQFC